MTLDGRTETARRRGSTTMAALAALVAAELRRLVRDRIALVFIIVMPVMVIVIVGATIGGGARHVPVGVLDEDGSAASAALLAQLRADGGVELTPYATRSDLQRDIRTSQQLGGLIIPSGFGAAADAGRPAEVRLLAVQVQDSQTIVPIVQSSLDRVGAELAAQAFVERIDGVDRPTAASAVDAVGSDLVAVSVQTRTVGTPTLANDNQFSYTAPSNLVLFVFITAVAGGGALVETRQLGIARRMLAAPIGAGTIVLGFGIVRLLIALVQATLIIAIGGVVFGVSWGQPAGVAALVVLYASMAVGAGLTVGAVARNVEQAMAFGIPLGIALGMLGGCMWPLDVVPEGLRTVGHLTPHAWAMDGFTDLVFEGKGIVDLGGTLAVLAAFAVGLLVLGTGLLHRTLVRGT